MTPVLTAHFESFGVRRESKGETDAGWQGSFSHPKLVILAQSIDEVLPLLRAAEAAAKSGSWVAVAISYDAAPAFDDALDTHRDAAFPLAWCGVFDERSAIAVPEKGFAIADFSPELSAAEYLAGIEAIKAYIAAGDTYQVNYTFPLRGTVSGDLVSCFQSVARSQGAGYSAYLDVGTHRILSFSPELFFRRDGMKLTTKPMKGTARRGRWIEEDDERVVRLASSAKDRAENVMIVDLLRNDLGRVAEVGSVKVPALFVVERLNRVLQMTSTVTATQSADADLVGVLGALFPCGSVTGAPKVRSTQIIRELEPHARGIYTGAIGLLSPHGDMVFNVAIRTLAVEAASGRATLGVGGGITWESTAEGEYEESLLKASFLTERWPEFSLLETLALIGGEYTLLDRHIARAADSARYFGFAFREKKVREALASVVAANPAGEWRVRLLIDPDGSPHTEWKPLGVKRDTPLYVSISPNAIDENDPLVFHKITARGRYDAALAECQPCDDVIFTNSRGEITESTIANVVVELDGKKWTPPREAGLLAGTMRAHLIDRGELFERKITLEELERVGKFWLVNSVRGWMQARLMAMRDG